MVALQTRRAPPGMPGRHTPETLPHGATGATLLRAGCAAPMQRVPPEGKAGRAVASQLGSGSGSSASSLNALRTRRKRPRGGHLCCGYA